MTLKQQALSLYREVFPEDSEDFAKSFTDRYFDNCCRYTLSDGKLVSMLYLLDCNIFDGEKNYPAKYLYAAATHPEHRNKGLMSRLISSVLGEEKIIVTKPATKELFFFYEKFGFSVCSFKDYVQREFHSSERLNAEQYKTLRKELLKNIPHISLSDEKFTLDGFTFYGNDNYCAAVDPEDKIVKEYLSEDAPHSKNPFAMWTLKNKKPVYFGLAMD